MSEATISEAGGVEAVIISGPRRGEIVRLDHAGDDTWSDQELALVSRALSELDDAFIGLLQSTKRLNQTVAGAIERMEARAEHLGGSTADCVIDPARE
jgi:hypothetical protein